MQINPDTYAIDIKKYGAEKIQSFFNAVRNNDIDLVKEFSEDITFSISVFTSKAFVDACAFGHWDLVNYFLSRNDIEFNTFNNQAFIEVCRFGEWDIFKKLLSIKEIDPSDQNNDVIMSLAFSCRLDFLKFLSKDSRINLFDQDGKAFYSSFLSNDESLIDWFFTFEDLPVSSSKNLALVNVIKSLDNTLNLNYFNKIIQHKNFIKNIGSEDLIESILMIASDIKHKSQFKNTKLNTEKLSELLDEILNSLPVIQDNSDIVLELLNQQLGHSLSFCFLAEKFSSVRSIVDDDFLNKMKDEDVKDKLRVLVFQRRVNSF